MKTVMIAAFANMINAGTVTMEDIPEEYREAVAEHMTATTVSNAAIQEDALPFGALFLGKQEIEVGIKPDDSPMCDTFINNQDVFGKNLGDNKMPEGIEYSVWMVENTFGKFEAVPKVLLDSTPTGFRLQVMSAPITEIKSGDKILRVDILIESDNYEDMTQTIYLIAR